MLDAAETILYVDVVGVTNTPSNPRRVFNVRHR
jgi:hypothetical protein